MAAKRPYSESFNAWVVSDCQDDSRLLRGQALKDALAWVKGKNISDIDYEFISASQETDKREAIEAHETANRILRKANTKAKKQIKKANYRIKIGSLIFAISLVGALISAVISEQRLNRAEQKVNLALQTSELEQEGNTNTKLFDFKQLEGLIKAMKTGENLAEVLTDSQKPEEYRTKSPVTSLQTILSRIRQKNNFAHDDSVNSANFSSDGNYMLTASVDRKAKLWDIRGKFIEDLEHKGVVYRANFSPNDKYIVTASADKTAKVWDNKGKFLFTLRHNDEVLRASFSPNGKLIASASVDKTVKLWKLDGTLLQEFKHKSAVLAVSFSPDSKTIASGSWDNSIKLWKIDGKLISDFKANSGGLRGISFSPDGKIIASAGGDNAIKLWKPSGILLATLRGHSKGLREVSFSPDGQTIASTGEDKTVILWNKEGVLKNPLVLGCNWVRDYLNNDANLDKSLEQTRTFCNGIAHK